MLRKLSLIVTLTALILMAGCSTLASEDYSNASTWPVTIVLWSDVNDQIGSAEVVIIGLVDDYSRHSATSLPKRENNPVWFGTQPRVNYTPADILDSFLRGVRSLAKKEMLTSSGAPDESKMKIFIVENGNMTRARAVELLARYGVRDYDRSIPVLYLFQDKRLLATYTYLKGPGNNGQKLKTQVGELFSPK